MKAINLSNVPFDTSNEILAFALYMAGVPFLQNDKGQEIPCSNRYSKEILNGLGFTGVTFEEGVDAAMAAGKKGHIEFRFQQVKQLPRLLKAYKSQIAELEAAKDTAHAERGIVQDILQKLTDGEMKPEEALLRLSVVSRKTSILFKNLWKKMVPRMQFQNRGKPQKFKETKRIRTDKGMQTVPVTGTTYPGFKIIPRNASEQLKKDMKLS